MNPNLFKDSYVENIIRILSIIIYIFFFIRTLTSRQVVVIFRALVVGVVGKWIFGSNHDHRK